MASGTESFTSTNGDGAIQTRTGLDQPWTHAYTGAAVNVTSNQVTTTGSIFAFGVARCDTQCDTDNNYAQLGMVSLPTDARWWTVWARMSGDTGSGIDGYVWEVTRNGGGGNGRYRLVRTVNEGRTDLVTGNFGSALAGTEVTRIEVEGTSVRGYVGGVLIASATDSTITSGKYTGFGGIDGNSVILADNFAFGDILRSSVPAFGARRRLPLLAR